MHRRRFLHAAASLPAGAALTLGGRSAQAAEDGVTAQSLTLGSSLALSGPLGSAGQEHVAGLQAALATVNAQGGVHGRELRLEVRDDGYQPARTVENVRQMLAGGGVLALVSCMGTANNAGLLPLVEQQGVPLVGPITGANSLRQAQLRHVFHVRASYGDETQRVVQQLVSVGVKDIAIVYLDNPFGREVQRDAEAALEVRGIRSAGAFALAVDGGNANAVVQAVLAARPGAVLLGTAGAATTPVVTGLRKLQAGLPLVGLSVTVFSSEFARLGAASQGLALTQVFPDPEKARLAVVRQYQAAMKDAGQTAIGSSSFEGWVNAQLLIEGLRRAGRDVNRDRLRQALAGIRRLDLGDFVLGYGGASPYVASRFVELAVLGAGGRRLA
ncbi:ABC transporter substrate-binding protein [Ideonella livida]|uniref:ABC transporter substrate-binding protein n=1 Tax=Ideonella livida TaxID=2707176 RepID=A0A7C9PIW8_9BURK|nr:ABC transporter substrate-binding protein [Ideonella livida]NDY92829.1 ABC transporter substrate-binding protein [Ideonella livida]